MSPNYFVVTLKGEEKSLSYFGEDSAKARSAYEDASQNADVDEVVIYSNPQAGNRSYPKDSYGYWRGEEAKLKAAADAAANKEKMEAEQEIAEARASIIEAQKILKALNAKE